MLGSNTLGSAFFGEPAPEAASIVQPSFIGSVTVVYAPSMSPGQIAAPFISSVTAVYAAQTSATATQTIVTTAGTYTWVCPPGITHVHVELFGGGGGGGGGETNTGYGGGGGGAYAARASVPVTPGTSYTFVVGAGGPGGFGSGSGLGTDGTDSSFMGDSGTQVVAKGGTAGSVSTKGTGGQASASTGDTGFKFSGGDGGNPGGASNGAGGGASGNYLAAGNNGMDFGAGTRLGGAGANGGGSGGNGGENAHDNPGAGTSPGGGGGGEANSFSSTSPGGRGADGKAIISTGIIPAFIASRTTLYAPTIRTQILAPFIPSATLVYSPTLPEIFAPFIGSKTRVWDIFSLFPPGRTFSGPGNGGETFMVRLNVNGVTDTATLSVDVTTATTLLELTGDGSFPSTEPFVVTIDDEVLYVTQVAPGSYRIRGRGVSNTTTAAHTAGATVSWGDSYDMALRAGSDIAHEFTADINSTGTFTYPGWLVCFDSSQAYLAGSRYPAHATEVLGVFDAGAGSSGTNRCDAAQPNAIATTAAVTDDCPAALSNPSRISSDIIHGDVALVRFTNPEVAVLDLGSRAVALLSWFGLKRVDASDTDVTFTDPDGYVVDTIPSGAGPGPFTGSVNGEWGEPIPLLTGIAPDASDAVGSPIPTPNPEPWTTVTLPGTDRYFTIGSGAGGFDEKGWPMCCLSVRQGNRRIPRWASWDWHDFAYVYTGFGVDDTFAQLLINRNGIQFHTLPEVELPGPQDIDGPDAVWDDATYYVAASWYVAIFGAPYIVVGPVIGGTPSGGDGSDSFVPSVSFPGGSGGTAGPPTIIVPPGVEGGSGGDIGGNPGAGLFEAAAV